MSIFLSNPYKTLLKWRIPESQIPSSALEYSRKITTSVRGWAFAVSSMFLLVATLDYLTNRNLADYAASVIVSIAVFAVGYPLGYRLVSPRNLRVRIRSGSVAYYPVTASYIRAGLLPESAESARSLAIGIVPDAEHPGLRCLFMTHVTGGHLLAPIADEVSDADIVTAFSRSFAASTPVQISPLSCTTEEMPFSLENALFRWPRLPRVFLVSTRRRLKRTLLTWLVSWMVGGLCILVYACNFRHIEDDTEAMTYVWTVLAMYTVAYTVAVLPSFLVLATTWLDQDIVLCAEGIYWRHGRFRRNEWQIRWESVTGISIETKRRRAILKIDFDFRGVKSRLEVPLSRRFDLAGFTEALAAIPHAPSLSA